MKTRILSGLIMAPLLIVLFLGGYVLLAACFVIGVMAVKEFYDGFGNMGIRPSYVTAYAAILGLYAINMFTSDYHWYMVWFFGCVVASLLYLFRIEERRLEDAMATITGIFYVIFFSYHVLLVEQTGEYSLMLWLIVLTAFGTDIMAYFAGVFFGKHKLCPKISPKKTIEGSIGGILGSVISQFGDLTASIFKRKMGIKDYGNLIPGHGGILDRFDSVLFTAPMVYYYILLILG